MIDFIRAAIYQALDGWTSDDELNDSLREMDSTLEVSTTSDGHDEKVESNEDLCYNHSTYDRPAKDLNAAGE